MNYRKLGRTGLKVSELCLGTMQWGWTADETASFAVMDTFSEAGGNFLDTADIYRRWAKDNPGGVSEEIIGRWLQARKNRRHIIVATKARAPMWAGPNGEGLSRAHLIQACEDSLRRLQTDYIDLYQTHWYDADTPIEETMDAIALLLEQRKIRAWGVSNFDVAELDILPTDIFRHFWPIFWIGIGAAATGVLVYFLTAYHGRGIGPRAGLNAENRSKPADG